MAKKDQSVAKGLPKRTSSKHAKEHRAQMWAAQNKRKDVRRAENAQRHKANLATRAAGGLTPWELACEKRAKVRAS